ncbi:MAG: aldo/keto reductase [Candidatus Pacebacteria bacterium]|nr:aldo/keto reductase [Candidatus Paceibacterota bacterium]
MLTRPFADYDLSTLMLGTVQFGMPYGIANVTGQPAYKDVIEILAAAIEGGVNCFDTAAAYGNSEDVLGRALRELGVLERVMVVTKVRALTPEELADPRRATHAIEQSVADSRCYLGIDTLPVVLFHREADAKYLPVLEDLKARGWLRHAGVSCDNTPGPATTFAEQPNVAALQIPANAFDHRHRDDGAFAAAESHGVGVFVRSVFLQGLMVMPEEAIPEALSDVVPIRRKLAVVAAEGGITLPELAIRYMLALKGVTCVLTGVETVEQVRANCAIFAHGPLDAESVRQVDAAVPPLPERLLTPRMWEE